MPAFAFDTLKAVRTLTGAGMQEPVAEAVVTTMNDAVTEGVATKADIAEVKAEVKANTARLEAGIAEVKADTARLESGLAEVKSDIGKLESGLAEVKSDIGKLESGLAEVKSDIGKLESGLARLESENARIESRLTARIETEIGAIKSQLNTLRWMFGFMAAMLFLMAGRMFGAY